MYWVYSLPNWLFGLLCVAAFVGFGLLGLPLTRRFAKRVHKEDHSHNDIVGYYLAAVTVFYGITLGLVAVGTWTNYSAVEDRVDREAQTLSSLYRDVCSYPEPLRTTLMMDLQTYTRQVIDQSWPQQRRGIVPVTTAGNMWQIQSDLLRYKPADLGQQVLHSETYKQYNELVEARRGRLESVNTGLPRALWWMVLWGAVISIVITFFFDMRSDSMHRWMTALMSGLLGLLIFLIATLDNPFRGGVSVGPQPLERVYDTVMR